METERVRGNDIGPTGRTVAFNLRRIRRQVGVDLRTLSKSLATSGRAISPSGLSKVENGDRRVDVDDLMALAIALDVNPHALLLPPTSTAGIQVEVTGAGRVRADALWGWARGAQLLIPSTVRPAWLEGSSLGPNEIKAEIDRARQIEEEDFRMRVDPRLADNAGPGVYALRESEKQPEDAHAATVFEVAEVPASEFENDD
jgi:transcriptional regulator with XRE-family HTH domain